MSTTPDAARSSLVDGIRSALAAAGDPARATAQQAYLKSAMPCHGVPMPLLRRIIREHLAAAGGIPASRAGWEASIRALWDDATHREQRYAALEIAAHRRARAWRDADVLPLAAHLAVSGAWWDLVDPIATTVVAPALADHREAVTPTLRGWASADDRWLRRVAIIAQLPHRGATDTELLADAIDANLAGSRFGADFFIRKAIGWALRQYSATDPDWVRAFVASRGEELSGLSRREALRRLTLSG